MKTPAPEFSRPFPVHRVSPGGSFEKLEADSKERAALSRRYGVPAVHALRAELQVKPWRGGGLKVTGDIACDLEVVSVVSLEAFQQHHSFSVLRYFLPTSAAAESSEDVDPIEGGQVDLGEMVAETVALELDPYPRKPGEVFAANDNTE